jgi:hypothetical protein
MMALTRKRVKDSHEWTGPDGRDRAGHTHQATITRIEPLAP